jgi:hypothetical protein
MPHAKSAEESEVIAAQAGVGRQPLQLARIAAADDDVVGLQDGAQFRHDLDHGSTPLLGAETLEGALTDPFLVTAFIFIRQMRKFHGCDHAIHDHGGAKPRTQAEEQHPAAFVAADCLHRCIVDDACGPAKGLAKIKSDPPGAEIVRLGRHPAVQYYSRITDGYGVEGPVSGKRMHARDHLTRGQIRSRIKLTHLSAAENARLHMVSADVDGEYFPVALHGFRNILDLAHRDPR